MTIKVNATLFMLASQASSRSEVRYYLAGTLIEPHHERGVMMVTTDGHRMIVVHDPEGECDRPIIVRLNPSALKKCRQRSFSRPIILSVDREAKTATLTEVKGDDAQDNYEARGALITCHDAVIEATFPDWKAVVPAPEGATVTGGFNPRYLRTFGKFGKLILKTLRPKSEAMRIWQANETGPAILRWSGVENVFALLMPMKWYGGDAPLPGFFRRPVPKPPAEDDKVRRAA